MTRTLAILALCCLATGLAAHVGDDLEHGLVAGLLHPAFGLDHLIAMIAVGLLAALHGGAWRWALPVAFVASMGLGGGLLASMHPGAWEWAVAASVIVLGLLLVAARAPRLALGIIVVAGALHGQAHFAEGAGTGYVSGMLVGTAVLHALGLGLGLLAQQNRPALRWTGGVVSVAGLALTVMALGS